MKIQKIMLEMLEKATKAGIETIELRDLPEIKENNVSFFNIDIDVKSAYEWYSGHGDTRATITVWSEEDHKMSRYFGAYVDDIVRWYLIAGF